MTTTYDLTTLVGKVRLTIGDTDTTSAVFTDEELTYFLTEAASNVLLASAMAARAWAAKYAANADSEKIGDYSYSQKIGDKYLALAKTLEDKADSVPVFEWSQPDYTAGSAITSEDD